LEKEKDFDLKSMEKLSLLAIFMTTYFYRKFSPLDKQKGRAAKEQQLTRSKEEEGQAMSSTAFCNQVYAFAK
jgi:hypothetical protein